MRQLGFLALAAAVILTLILLSQTMRDDRDICRVDSALLGHWQAENGDELYFGADLATAVGRDGTLSYHPYRVLMANDADGWIKILIANNDGQDVVRVIRFNPDRESYQTSIRLEDSQGHAVEKVVTIHYVDEQTAPE
jgi:hypothetical protein